MSFVYFCIIIVSFHYMFDLKLEFFDLAIMHLLLLFDLESEF